MSSEQEQAPAKVVGSLWRRWQACLLKLPSADSPPAEMAAVAYSAWVDSLLPHAAEREAARQVEQGGLEDEPGYWLVVCEDGQAPTLVQCQSVEDMVERMAGAVGQDTFVFPFVGEALKFTAGPRRYLFLPGGEAAMSFPAPGHPAVTAPVDEVTEPMADDYYVGDEVLASGGAVRPGRQNYPSQSRRPKTVDMPESDFKRRNPPPDLDFKPKPSP